MVQDSAWLEGTREGSTLGLAHWNPCCWRGFPYGQKSENVHRHNCLGPNWAVCWVLPEGGEGVGLVSSGAGGRGQLPVTNPKGEGLNQIWLASIAEGPMAGV